MNISKISGLESKRPQYFKNNKYNTKAQVSQIKSKKTKALVLFSIVSLALIILGIIKNKKISNKLVPSSQNIEKTTARANTVNLDMQKPVNEIISEIPSEIKTENKDIDIAKTIIKHGEEFQQQQDMSIKRYEILSMVEEELDKNQDDLTAVLDEEREKRYIDVLKKHGIFDFGDVEYKNALAYKKATQEPLNGAIYDTLNSGRKVELYYKDGVLQKSIKYSSDGKVAHEKIYTAHKDFKTGLGTIKKTYIKKQDNKTSVLTTYKKDSARKAGLLEINPDSKEKTEKMRLMTYKDGILLLDARNNTSKVVQSQNGVKKVLLERKTPFPTQEEPVSKDGYKLKYLAYSMLKDSLS